MDEHDETFSRPFPDARDRTTITALFLLFAALYVALSLGHVESVDAEMDYQTARGFLVHRDGAIHDDTPTGRLVLEDSFAGSRGRNGKFYSWHGPGRPLVGVAFLAAGDVLARTWPELLVRDREYWRAMGRAEESISSDFFQRWLFSLSSALFAAGTVALVYAMARVMGTRRSAAFLLALIAGLATHLGPASRSALNAAQATFLVAFAWYLWLRHGRRGPAVRGVGPLSLVVAGIAAGLAVWTRPTATFLVFVLSVYALFVLIVRRHERSLWKDGLAYAVGILAVASAILFWNHHRFGDWSQWGHGEAIAGEQFVQTEPRFLLLNFLGEWISPGRGLLFFAPILWLLPLAVFARDRKTRSERTALLLAGLFGCLWPILSSGWHGGPFYGPRYLLPVVPLFLVALAPAIGRILERRGIARGMVYGLAGLGVLFQLPGFLVSYVTGHEVAIAAVKEELLPEAKAFVREQLEPLVPAGEFARLERFFDASTRAELDAEVERIARLDANVGAYLEQQLRAWDREHQYLWHLWAPRYTPVRVQARILWRRSTHARTADEETFDLAEFFGVPTAPERFRPETWEARGLRHFWPVALDERLGTAIATPIFRGLEALALVALVVAFAFSRDRRPGTSSSH